MRIDIHFNSQQLNRIEERLNTMPTQADLDTALDNLSTAVTDAATRVSADLKALADKIAAIPGAPDLSPEIAKVQASIDAIKAIDPAAPAA